MTPYHFWCSVQIDLRYKLQTEYVHESQTSNEISGMQETSHRHTCIVLAKGN